MDYLPPEGYEAKLYDYKKPKTSINYPIDISHMKKLNQKMIYGNLLNTDNPNRPLINVKPLSSNSPGYDPNSNYDFHQAIGHPTDTLIRLKHEIQNLIDLGKITDPENPSTRNNSFLNYQNVPPPATMMINSGVSEKKY